MSDGFKEAQIKEILKCAKDPVYFINTYCKIQHPTKGTLPFKTYPFQDKCINDFINHRFNIVLKSRQLGLSTVSAAYVLWFILFSKDKNVLVIATKMPVAQNFIQKVKFALSNLPKWLVLPQITGETKQSISFSNGSQVKAVPTSANSARSEALSLLICDEAAHIEGFDEIWTGLYPTLTAGGQAIILSTPKGVGGRYYTLYTDAEAGLNDFNPIKLSWDVHPEHNQEWFEKETKGLPRKDIAQEYLCSFISSGDTFLQNEELDWLRSIARDPIAREGADRCVWVWQHPKPGHKYVLSADVARGDAADFSTFHILDCDTSEVVVEYKGKLPPDRFAVLINDYGLKYNKALVCPENNSFGFMVCTRLKDKAYPKLYYKDMRGIHSSYIADPEEVAGISTDKSSRPQMLSRLEEAIRNKQLRSYSSRLINELTTFVWKGSRAQPLKGQHDDLIMSIAINAWLNEFGMPQRSDAAYMQAILQATQRISRPVTDLPHHNMPSISDYSIYTSRGERPAHSHEIPNDLDFDWILK